jgi:hypothetical protein
MTPWWGAALGAFVGVLLTAFVLWVRRKRELAASWHALRSEITYCHEMAIAYLQAKDTVEMPLARLPTLIYEKVIPTIIAERSISEKEFRDLMEFYGLVYQLNRGLDFAVDAQQRDNESLRKKEVSRNRVKASHFRPGDKSDYYTQAIAIANKHCALFENLCYRMILWLPV